MDRNNDFVAWWAVYLIASALTYFAFSHLLGMALALNAVISLVLAIAAGAMGKRRDVVLLLGFFLGPVGGIAGLIAAPPGEN